MIWCQQQYSARQNPTVLSSLKARGTEVVKPVAPVRKRKRCDDLLADCRHTTPRVCNICAPRMRCGCPRRSLKGQGVNEIGVVAGRFLCRHAKMSLLQRLGKMGIFCYEVRKPVCGCDKKTYNNDCERLRAK